MLRPPDVVGGERLMRLELDNYDDLVERLRRRYRRQRFLENAVILVSCAIAGYALALVGCAVTAPVHAVQPTPTSWRPPAELHALNCLVGESVSFPSGINDPA